jgi:hypothetical protein
MNKRSIGCRLVLFFLPLLLLTCSKVPYLKKDQVKVGKVGPPSVLEKISGKVSVLQGDTDIWVGATQKMEVFEGDQVRTLENSRVKIKLPDGHELLVGQNSVIHLKSIVADSETNRHITLIDLSQGAVWAQVTDPASFMDKLRGKATLMEFQFKISAPNVSAFPLGTKFVVMFSADDSVLISSCKGDLEISGPGGGLLIPERHFSTVAGNNPPDPIRTSEYIEERKDQPNFKFCFTCHNENFKSRDLDKAFK